MSLRTAHGRARELGRLAVVESRPWDEQRPACPPAAARPGRDASGRFLPGNKAGTARRVRAGSRGAITQLEAKADPAARAALAFGRRYASHRRRELTEAHGEISAGVGSMIESAGELLASARYWGARAAAEASPDFARLAATLVAGSRQAERDAWQLASLEAASRPKAPADASPWLKVKRDASEPAAHTPAPAADADVPEPRTEVRP